MRELLERFGKKKAADPDEEESAGKVFQIALRDGGKEWTYSLKGPGVAKKGSGKNLHQALAYVANAITRS